MVQPSQGLVSQTCEGCGGAPWTMKPYLDVSHT